MIAALSHNFIFWSMYWIKSERGGAFYFENTSEPSAEKQQVEYNSGVNNNGTGNRRD